MICGPVTVTFFHKAPPVDDFMVTNSGVFILKKPLKYNLVQKYNFTVTAKVSLTYTEYGFKADVIITLVFFPCRITAGLTTRLWW